MRYCSSCGVQNRDGSQFCFSCGNRLSQPSAPAATPPVTSPQPAAVPVYPPQYYTRPPVAPPLPQEQDARPIIRKLAKSWMTVAAIILFGGSFLFALLSAVLFPVDLNDLLRELQNQIAQNGMDMQAYLNAFYDSSFYIFLTEQPLLSYLLLNLSGILLRIPGLLIYFGLCSFYLEVRRGNGIYAAKGLSLVKVVLTVLLVLLLLMPVLLAGGVTALITQSSAEDPLLTSTNPVVLFLVFCVILAIVFILPCLYQWFALRSAKNLREAWRGTPNPQPLSGFVYLMLIIVSVLQLIGIPGSSFVGLCNLLCQVGASFLLALGMQRYNKELLALRVPAYIPPPLAPPVPNPNFTPPGAYPAASPVPPPQTGFAPMPEVLPQSVALCAGCGSKFNANEVQCPFCGKEKTQEHEGV